MKIITIQKITNIISEDNIVLSSVVEESYILTPAPTKVLKHIKTGDTVSTKICVSKKALINNYIEVDDPNTP